MKATWTLLLTVISATGLVATAKADEASVATPPSASDPAPAAMLAAPTATVFGWAEYVMLDPERRWLLNAKLDTGADTSSLDARDARRVRVGGESYVRFEVTDPATGEVHSLRRRYVRTVRIREHDGKHQRRRVVLMTVCLGNQERTIEVTLSDRTQFAFPMLLGRSALSGLAVVDPRFEWTRDPSCWAGEEEELEEADSDRQTPSHSPSAVADKPTTH